MGTIKRDNSDWGKMKVIVFVWKEHKGQILIWPFAYYLTGHFVKRTVAYFIVITDTFGITKDRLDDWSKNKHNLLMN
jgi:hypothetical protein